MKEEDERRLLPAATLADAENAVVAAAGDDDESLDGALTAAASCGDGAWARRAMQNASKRERREAKSVRERGRELSPPFSSRGCDW